MLYRIRCRKRYRIRCRIRYSIYLMRYRMQAGLVPPLHPEEASGILTRSEQILKEYAKKASLTAMSRKFRCIFHAIVYAISTDVKKISLQNYSQEKFGLFCRHFFVAFRSFYALECPIDKKSKERF
jgi:hypothetical protein